MRKIFIFAIIASSAFVLWSAPTKVFAATYTVSKEADTADGLCDSDCSLREAVIAANGGDADSIIIPSGTFIFTRTTAGEDEADQGDLDFTDSDTTTLIGAGVDDTIIDADATDRVFDVHSGASIDVSELVAINGAVDDANGAAVRSVGNAVFTHVEFRASTLTGDGSTSFYGGGVFCSGGTLTLERVEVSGNAIVEGGTQVYGGGIAVDSGCSAALNEVVVAENSAYHGGGIYVMTSASTTTTMIDVTVSSNIATDAGAGMYIAGADTDNAVMVNRALIEANAANSGGGIFAQAPIDITNATFYQNSATDAGGALGSNPGVSTPLIRIAFSSLTHNSATIAGGIYSDSSTNIHIKASILAFNGIDDSYDDCYGIITSEDYNYIHAASCDITAQPHDEFDTDPGSFIYTAVPEEVGGNINVLKMWGPETLDIVPEEDCTDAIGAALPEDARGMTRPQNGSCDRGAYEKDQTLPVVSMFIGTDIVECGIDAWTDAGAEAEDGFSGELEAVTEDTVDTHTVGVQEVVYTSTVDIDGNSGTGVREVTVQDKRVPVITLVGDAAVTVHAEGEYVDSGATVSDECDSGIELITDNPTNTSVPGEYTVTYTAIDSSGNEALVVTRTVTVEMSVPSTIDKDDIRIRRKGVRRVISWPAVDGATFYKFKITTKKGKVLLRAKNLSQHKKILKKKWVQEHIVVGRKYKISVRACNESGCSAWSDVRVWKVKQ